MSDQGDAGQWRPASRHNGENSAPDDTTGPLPAVSEDEAAAPGFPPMGGTSSTWSADDDEAPAGGFPNVSPPAEAQSAPSSGRAPFEPADPLPAPRSSDSTTPISDEAWSSYVRSVEERSSEATDSPSSEATDPPSSAGQEAESSGPTPPFGVEMPDVKPYEAGESFSAYGTPGEQIEESSHGYGTSGEKPSGLGKPSFGSGSRGEESYEPGGSSFGSDTPGEKSFGSEKSSFGRRPGESFAYDQRVTAEEQAAENEFFAPDDHSPMWDKVVAPAGPPPQPGKPSSGNLRLPDWMRDEAAGGGEYTG
ncbi:MAG: hypothetical protein JWR24_4085, partial [Actinoallomurus sp.]|nr:hypothetical protein [Actinoallomurus sp.]